jgi:hypothetical protein
MPTIGGKGLGFWKKFNNFGTNNCLIKWCSKTYYKKFSNLSMSTIGVKCVMEIKLKKD